MNLRNKVELRFRCFCVAVLLVAVQLSLIINSNLSTSPVSDEYGHMFAGLSWWQYGDTQLFNVNPPTIRAIGAFPGHLIGLEVDATEIQDVQRPEFYKGREVFQKNASAFVCSLQRGRLLVSCFTLAGSLLLIYWSRQTAGLNATIIAAVFWVFQPQIISHGALITSDVPVAVGIAAATWFLSRLNHEVTLGRAAVAGIMIGAAISIKFTAFVLVPGVVLLLAWRTDRYSLRYLSLCLLVCGLSSLMVIGIPYQYDGWGKPIEKFEFVSGLMSDIRSGAVWFSGRLLFLDVNMIRIPLPEQFVCGIDRQQYDFEQGLGSYAAGMKADHGWWWFYLYSMLVKLPLGTLLAIGATIALLLRNPSQYSRGLGIVLLVVGTILLATALQSGFAQQHRYILSVYPLLFLIVGVVGARALDSGSGFDRWCARGIQLGALWTVLACLWVAPNWMASFNWVAGGNESGWRTLFNDASDWGQDAHRVSDWINDHQGGAPVYVRPFATGKKDLDAFNASIFFSTSDNAEDLPRPSWFVVSKSSLAWDAELDSSLAKYEPVEYIGGTHIVYYLE